MERESLLRDKVDPLFNVFLVQKPEETNELSWRYNQFCRSEIGSDVCAAIFSISLRGFTEFYSLPCYLG